MSSKAYEDEGTPEEVSRRTFMTNAVIAMGGVIAISLAIPLGVSMIPAAGTLDAAWSPLSAAERDALMKATEVPTKVTFMLHSQDGYYAPKDVEHFVWAIKADDATMRKHRPGLYEGSEKMPFPIVNLGFVVFSSICPHLGCLYAWDTPKQLFVCPCHGSKYTQFGEHVAGPAQRGLDPLPLRDHDGTVQVTWIQYKGNENSHLILSYG